jgi:hypothetical protein
VCNTPGKRNGAGNGAAPPSNDYSEPSVCQSPKAAFGNVIKQASALHDQLVAVVKQANALHAS